MSISNCKTRIFCNDRAESLSVFPCLGIMTAGPSLASQPAKSVMKTENFSPVRVVKETRPEEKEGSLLTCLLMLVACSVYVSRHHELLNL